MQYRTQSLYWKYRLEVGARMIRYTPLFNTMKEKGITSYALIKKLGFPQSTYYAIKRGENISTHTPDQLCRLLRCRVEDVLEYVEDET